MREAREETGLTVSIGAVFGRVELPGLGDEVYDVTDFAATVVADESDALPSAGDDADDVRWVSRAELIALPTSAGLVDTLDAWSVWP